MHFVKSGVPMLFVVLIGCLGVQGAVAEDKKPNREKEMIRRLQLAQRQLEEEKGKLQQEKSALETQVKDATEKQLRSEKEAAQAMARNTQLTKELKGVKGDLESTQEKLAATSKREQEMSSKLIMAEGDNRKLTDQLKASRQDAAVCEEKNVALYLHGRELLARLQGESVLDKLLAKEPVFGIKQVQIENTVQEYEDKLAAQRFQRKAGN